jgi:GxxExxY protein
MKIHTKLGKGFKEIVYKDAIEVEMNKDAGILYEREKPFSIIYEEVILPHKFNADFFVFGAIVLEIKAVSQLHADTFRQTLNYLKASKVKLGIIINFGTDKLGFQRIVCTR